MARLVSQECGKNVNRKRIRRLMKENDLLSAVRRRKWSDEVYAKRRELKANLPADLIKQNFFALAPRKRMLEDNTAFLIRRTRNCVQIQSRACVSAGANVSEDPLYITTLEAPMFPTNTVML